MSELPSKLEVLWRGDIKVSILVSLINNLILCACISTGNFRLTLNLNDAFIVSYRIGLYGRRRSLYVHILAFNIYNINIT